MHEPLPNCPLCAGAMQIGGGPEPDAWCDKVGCSLFLVPIPMPVRHVIATLRKPLTPDEAERLIHPLRSCQHCDSIPSTAFEYAEDDLRAALTGKR